MCQKSTADSKEIFSSLVSSLSVCSISKLDMIQEIKYRSASLSAYDYCIVHMNNKTVINNDNTKLDWVN